MGKYRNIEALSIRSSRVDFLLNFVSEFKKKGRGREGRGSLSE